MDGGTQTHPLIETGKRLRERSRLLCALAHDRCDHSQQLQHTARLLALAVVQTLPCRSHPERYAAAAARAGGLCMKITSTTDLEFPRLHFSIRSGEVKDLPADPEAAALILASAYIREVAEPESKTTRKDT
jgi:hypothetical protein